MLSFEEWKRNFRGEYDNYQGKPEQIARRSARNKSRRRAIKAGLISKNDDRDINHKNGNPNDKSLSNLEPMNVSKNRSRKV